MLRKYAVIFEKTMAGSRDLLITVAPTPEENLIGYIIRLTEINDYDTPSWILQLAGIKNYLHSKCNFVSNNSIDLSSLAKLARVSTSSLRSLQYERTRINNFCEGYLIYGLPVPQYMVRLNKPKVCPACLDELGYAQRIWDLTPVTACPKHMNVLLEECPACGRQITWSRSRLSSCRCGCDWRKALVTQVQPSDLNVVQYIHNLCGLTNDEQIKTHSENPLLSLGLCAFVAALFFVASQLDGIIDTKGKHLAPSKTNSEIHGLLSRAFEVFDSWPNNFFKFLSWRREQIQGGRFVKGILRDFKQYKSALYVQLSSGKYDFIRAAFEEYLATEWDGGNASAVARINREGYQRKYVSRREAKNYLKVGVGSVDRLIKRKLLKAVVSRRGKSRLILIEAGSAAELKLRLERAVGIKQVEKLLGLTSKRIKELVAVNLLRPFMGPDVDGSGDWKFDGDEISALLFSLRRAAMNKKQQDTSKKHNFLMAVRILSRFKIDAGQFSRAILAGDILPCNVEPKRNGVQSLLFSKSELSKYVGEL